jgi:hypothetical protein
MPQLRDVAPVKRSAVETQAAIERFFLLLEGADGVARLRLRVPAGRSGHGISLDREVRVEARSLHESNGVPGVIAIVWEPEGPGVFPRFDGTLIVTGFGNANASYIELDGVYTPPFGAAGQVFDAAIGHQIARATAREFLKDLKAAVEKRTAF